MSTVTLQCLKCDRKVMAPRPEGPCRTFIAGWVLDWTDMEHPAALCDSDIDRIVRDHESGDPFAIARAEIAAREGTTMPMTIMPAERTILDKTAELWNAFAMLPEEHPSDLKEFQAHIHALQNIVLSRPAHRQLREEQTKSG